MLQLLKPLRLELVLCSKRNHCNEKLRHHNERAVPARCNSASGFFFASGSQEYWSLINSVHLKLNKINTLYLKKNLHHYPIGIPVLLDIMDKNKDNESKRLGLNSG